MKNTFRTFFAAIAAVAALASCDKYTTTEENTMPQTGDGLRTITINFDADTRTTIGNDLSTAFADGDRISVYSSDSQETCTVNVTGGKAWFSTSLSGELTAVYPAGASTKNGKTGKITLDLAPYFQSGTFSDGHIAKATIASEATTALFKHETTLLIVTPPSGTKQFKIISTSSHLISNGEVTENGISRAAMKEVVVGDGTRELGKCYVSISAGAKLSELTFDNGTHTKSISSETETQAGVAYTITNEGWEHLCAIIGGRKWALKNLGATTIAGSPATCYGDYYCWGETETRYTGITVRGESTVSFSGWKSGHSNGFASSDVPSYTGASLDAGHDAATQALGSPWRTPTNEDFTALFEACGGDANSTGSLPAGNTTTTAKGIYWCSNYYGVKGFLFSDGESQLFFPAAGTILDKAIYRGGERGLYWSSSLYSNNSNFAMYANMQVSGVNPSDTYYRYLGLTIRPVKD